MFNLHLSILISQPDSVKQGSNPPPYSYPGTSILGTVKAVGGSMKAIIIIFNDHYGLHVVLEPTTLCLPVV